MNYTKRKAKNQVFFYITYGSGFMTPLISVLIIPGAVSTAVNMVAAMVKRICNGIEKPGYSDSIYHLIIDSLIKKESNEKYYEKILNKMIQI